MPTCCAPLGEARDKTGKANFYQLAPHGMNGAFHLDILCTNSENAERQPLSRQCGPLTCGCDAEALHTALSRVGSRDDAPSGWCVGFGFRMATAVMGAVPVQAEDGGVVG